jgi:hypothetical protein
MPAESLSDPGYVPDPEAPCAGFDEEECERYQRVMAERLEAYAEEISDEDPEAAAMVRRGLPFLRNLRHPKQASTRPPKIWASPRPQQRREHRPRRRVASSPRRARAPGRLGDDDPLPPELSALALAGVGA